MELNVAKELATLGKMTVGQLRSRYSEVFSETTSANNKTWLIKRIVWRLQAQAEGDLSDRARQRAAEIANDADLRRKAPVVSAATAAPRKVLPFSPADGSQRVPPPGSVIIQEELLFLPRIERGREVLVLRDVLPIAAQADWRKQRKFWTELLAKKA